jgi:hypothetical protein
MGANLNRRHLAACFTPQGRQLLLQGRAGREDAPLAAGQQGPEWVALGCRQQGGGRGGIALQLLQLGAAGGEVGADAGGVGAEGPLLQLHRIRRRRGGPLQQAVGGGQPTGQGQGCPRQPQG